MSIQVTSTPPSALLPTGTQNASGAGGVDPRSGSNPNAGSASGGMATKASAPVPPMDVTPANKAAQAVSVQARQMASVQSGGLSGLMADLSQAVDAHGDDLPAPVQNAIRQLFSIQISAENPPSAEDIQAAFDRSGLFTESRLAGQLAETPSATQTSSAIPADIKSLLLVLHQSLSDWANDLGDASVNSGTQSQGGTNTSSSSGSSLSGSSVSDPQASGSTSSGYSATGQLGGASSASASATSVATESGMISVVAATAVRPAPASVATTVNTATGTQLLAAGSDVSGGVSASSPAVPSGAAMLLGSAALLAAAEVADTRAEVTNTLLAATYGSPAATQANGAAASAGSPDGVATGATLTSPASSGRLPAGAASAALAAASVADAGSPVEQTGLVAGSTPVAPGMVSSAAMPSAANSSSGDGQPPSASSAPSATASSAPTAPSGVGTGGGATAQPIPASVVAGGAGLAAGLVPGTTAAAPQILPGMAAGAPSQIPATLDGENAGAVLPTTPQGAAPLTGAEPALQAAAQEDVLETALAMFSDPRLASQAAAAMLTGSGTAPPLARAMTAVDALAAFLLQQQGDMSEDDTGLTAPPPFRDGPTTAQGATPSALPEGDDLVAVARHLLSGSEAALAHQKLLQMASLPDTEKSSQTQPSQNHWMFEIPLSTPQGTAVAQFAIDRDGGGEEGADEDKPVWRVRFAVDVEPLGPVQAQLALSGGQTWVTLWANRPASLERLRAGADFLSDAMADEAFETEIAFHPVAVPKKSGSGRFVDHTS